ncbi:hypothetical protein TNCV_3491271 [Trichonephila clavipes]|nr:hypothetical protein TNCV_3491271 [Trichonephila clavipes]
MKWMHLGEKSCQFNETSLPISVRKQRICHSTRQALSSGCDKKTTTACSLLKYCRYRANRYDFTMVHSEMLKSSCTFRPSAPRTKLIISAESSFDSTFRTDTIQWRDEFVFHALKKKVWPRFRSLRSP